MVEGEKGVDKILKFLTTDIADINAKKYGNVLAVFALMILWSLFLKALFGILKENQLVDIMSAIYNVKYKLFMACIWAPLWEEVTFRWAPYQIMKKLNPDMTIPIIIIVSVAFGWLHGSAHNVMIQGIYGLGMSLVYIKNGYDLKTSIALHALWNFMVIIGFDYLVN